MQSEPMPELAQLEELQKQLEEITGISMDSGACKLIRELDEEALKGFYGMAYRAYDSGKYQDAAHYFRFLTALGPQNYDYWKGLAASLQMLKQYENALNAYSIAALIDGSDPYLHMHAADCCFALGLIDRALKAVNSVELTAQGKDEYQHLISQLALIRQAWSNQNNDELVTETTP